MNFWMARFSHERQDRSMVITEVIWSGVGFSRFHEESRVDEGSGTKREKRVSDSNCTTPARRCCTGTVREGGWQGIKRLSKFNELLVWCVCASG